MPISTVVKVLAGQYRNAQTHDELNRTYDLLVKYLPPAHRKVFNHVKLHGWTTSGAIAKYCNMTVNAASTFLKDLHDLGLLHRYEDKNERGRRYHYNNAYQRRADQIGYQLELPF